MSEFNFIFNEMEYNHKKCISLLINGISIGVLADYKLPVESMDLSIITGLSIVNFGDFKSGDVVVEPSHSPIKFRIGLEFGIHFSR